jgi:membrane protein required for colicin V production
MTALDVIVILLIGFGIYNGWQRGFTRAVLSLGVWALVILALWVLHGPLSRLLENIVGTVSGAYAVAFLIIFGGILFGGNLVATRITKRLHRSRIGPADKGLGAGVGALKGLLFATLFYMSFSFLYDMIWGRAERRPRWIADAFTYPLVHGTANTFVDLVEARRGPEAPAERPTERPRARRK